MAGTNNFKTLQQELQQALSLINDYSARHKGTYKAVLDTEGLNNTQSLLERCAAVVNADNGNTKPTLRILHHFACSGGTLISKCLAAQPNVFLLSELHPTTRLGFNADHALYTPRDIITQAFYGRLPKVGKLAEKVFVAGIKEAEQHVRELGGDLIIRAHTHADYCTESIPPEQDTLTSVLNSAFNIKQLVTVRNPIDSFLSLQQNGWVHFEPSTFDEYCRRFLLFVKSFEPEKELRIIADILNIRVSESGFDVLDVFKVSGDSGRSGLDISPRPRKPVPDELKKEIEKSECFSEVQQLLDYQGL